MKHCIIIEDRVERQQKQLTEEQWERLCQLAAVDSELPGYEEGKEYDFSAFDDYDIVAVHRTLLAKTNLINEFMDYAKNKKKNSIIFSGSITQQLVTNGGNTLAVEATVFYQSIVTFLETYDDSQDFPLYRFLYGNEWELPLLLRFRFLKWKEKDGTLQRQGKAELQSLQKAYEGDFEKRITELIQNI